MKFHWSKKYFFLLLLGVYHSVLTFFAYHYILTEGGDSTLYWFKNPSTQYHSWLDFFNYGTDAILFLNYPFVHFLQLPFVWGFILYSFVGFLGILQLYRLSVLMLQEQGIHTNTVYFLYGLFLLPNLHFWTSFIGKEAIIFLALSTLFLKGYEKKFLSVGFILSFIIVFIIRPHVALMLLITLVFVLGFSTRIVLLTKVKLLSSSLAIAAICFYMFLQLSEIKRFDWDRIQRFNLGSLRSFEHSESFVPMESYGYPMKLFSFYFRPLFYGSSNMYWWVLSIENLLILLLHVLGVILLFRYRKYVFQHDFVKFIFLFALIAGLLFVQRYSGFGIFARTKIMIQPFVLVVFLWLINWHFLARNKTAPFLKDKTET